MNSKKKANTKKTKNRKKEVNESGDIKGIFYIVIGILLGISVYTELAGVLSVLSRKILYGLIGVGILILPLYLVYFGIDTIRNKGTIKYNRRLFGTLLTTLTIVVFISTVKLQSVGMLGFLGSWDKIVEIAAPNLHGGVIGHAIAYPISGLIGFVGAYTLYLATTFIGVILTLDITILDLVNDIKGKFKVLYTKKSVNKKGSNERKYTNTEPIIDTSVDNEKQDFIKGINNKIQILDFMKNSSIDEEVGISSIKESAIKEISPIINIPEENHNQDEIKGTKRSNSDVKSKEIDEIIISNEIEVKKEYKFPKIDLLKNNSKSKLKSEDKKDLIENASKLEETLANFGVEAKVLQVTKGPSVTRFELQPSPGVKVSKIVNLQDDIALGLAASGVRMEAPIPGKAAIGIEVPNQKQTPVFLREVLDSKEFENTNNKIAFALGKDISGKCVVGDLSRMPHMLIAGATGSGKSVCINTLIISVLYKYSPDEVKLLMVDPKVVELSVYNGIPHLLIPVVTDPKKAAGALNWAVNEMNKRYNLFSEMKVKNIESYNNLLEKGTITEKLPYIVIIVDELADLMMACPGDVEDYICRLAQMARAAGMHLIIATQRPSVDVITGVIKANIPSRISFAVSSGIDSRTVLDQVGAEKLLGRGDMLYYPIGESKPLRVQGAFISEEEVEAVVDYIKETEDEVDYKEEILEHINSEAKVNNISSEDESDELLEEAINIVVEYQQASISFLQRRLKVGFNRASRIMEELEDKGIISKKDGSKPRQVLISTTEEIVQ